MCMGHNHSSREIEGQGQKSRVALGVSVQNAVGGKFVDPRVEDGSFKFNLLLFSSRKNHHC